MVGRLSADSGDMFSQQRAAHYRNLKINQSWYEHQRNAKEPAPQRHQPPPESYAPGKPREHHRTDLHPAPAARTPPRVPASTPERQQARLELRSGFNATAPVSRPENQVRRDYTEQPQRGDSEARN